MKLLDCTLRDGGYYNNWDFDFKVVESYLSSVALANIDYVELGLRNFPKDGFLGPFAYTTEVLLNSMQLPSGPTYGVMIDAKTILERKSDVKTSVDQLFVDANKSKLGLVRIAAHFNEVDRSVEIAQALKEKGYIVGFNLMQAGGKSDSLLKEKAAIINDWGSVDVLYFADSFGNMDSNEVERISSAIQSKWIGDLGIHTHNNMGKGLDNTIQALESGVEWVDVTITGMGRGAGNTQTENLLAHLSKIPTKYNSAPVYELVIRHFDSMQKQYGWGSNLLYFIGAQNNVHPTYIQNLLSSKRYGADEVVGAIDYLSKADESASYFGHLLEEALDLSMSSSKISGNNLLEGAFTGREVLIIGSGESVLRYNNGIVNYIVENNPVVIAININENISEELVDYYCVSHNSKFLSQKDKYLYVTKPIILPKHRFTKEEISKISHKSEVYDFGLQVKENEFSVKSDKCIIPSEVTAGYALGIAINGKADKIKMVGFDGYSNSDVRQKEMIDLLTLFSDYSDAIETIALTPTSYSLNQRSVYEPIL